MIERERKRKSEKDREVLESRAIGKEMAVALHYKREHQGKT